MKTKYIIVLGGTAILGFGAYLFFLNKKKSMLITAGEGSLGIQQVPSKPSGSTSSGSASTGSTKSGSTPSSSASTGSTPSGSTSSSSSSGSASTGSTPSGSTGSTQSGSTGSTPSGSSSYGSSLSGSSNIYTSTPYTEAEAATSAILVTSKISEYLNAILANPENQPKPDYTGRRPTASGELKESNTAYSFVNKPYSSLEQFIAYFKTNGASILMYEFKNTLPKMSRANADQLVSAYPKLYLKRVLKDFPTFFEKHALDYELTPKESTFVNDIKYSAIEEEQFKNWTIENNAKRIVIKEAFYGRGRNLVDIKDKLISLIKRGVYSFTADNMFAGRDPERGEKKGAYVNYTIDGKDFTLSTFNGATKDFNRNWNGGGLSEGQTGFLIK
jgi:hypothetical protein